MSGRIRWDRARLAGRRTLNIRTEAEREDRASKWLAKAERRRQERRDITPSRTPGNWTTASSTEAPPW
jgi:hypothetical protein